MATATKPRKKSFKPLTEEQRQAKRAEQREKMEAAVEQLQTEGGWKKWIESHRTMDRFSFYNRLLLMLQVPGVRERWNNADHMTRSQFQVEALDAPWQVQTYNAWKKLGRQVRRGEKCVVVLQPIFKNVKDTDEDGNETEVRRLIGFNNLSEFDITQTDGPAIPKRERPKDITGDDLAHVLPILTAYAEKLGYKVVYKGNMGSTYGSVNTNTITINNDHCINTQVATLIHEIAHTREPEVGKKLNYQNYSRGDAEVIVETVTYMVCEFLGLDTSGFSFAYVTNWARPDDSKLFKKFTQAIDKVANEIEDAIRKAMDEDEVQEAA